MKKILYLFVLIIINNNHLSNTMDQDQAQTHLIIIPGQNGMGGQNINDILPYFKDKPTLKHHIGTPNIIIDFGQQRCQSYLKQTINSLNQNTKAIIHASSQGTATALNYTAKNPTKIAALILEASMISGNSAIHYNVPVPYSYYILPYLAKLMYPFYAPAGEQPILTIDQLPQDLPIIILHHANDPQLPYKDAKALYAFLKESKKNKNIYLMTKRSQWAEHVLLLGNTRDQESINKINAINKILENLELLPNNKYFNPNYNIDLSIYQPVPKQKWLNHFNRLLAKEQNFWHIDWGIKTMCYSLASYILYNKGIINQITHGLIG